jgi:hypothetical protein
MSNPFFCRHLDHPDDYQLPAAVDRQLDELAEAAVKEDVEKRQKEEVNDPAASRSDR